MVLSAALKPKARPLRTMPGWLSGRDFEGEPGSSACPHSGMLEYWLGGDAGYVACLCGQTELP